MTYLAFVFPLKQLEHKSHVHKNVDIYTLQRNNQNMKAMQENYSVVKIHAQF